MKTVPCKDCPKKGCGVYHDKCPEYQEYKKENARMKEEQQERTKYEVDYKRMEIERAVRRQKERTRLKQR